MLPKITLRPSMLPKLEQCPCYVPSEGTSDAAQRGTEMDEAARILLETGDEEKAFANLKHYDGKADEKEGVRWAVHMAQMLTAPEKVYSQKDDCKLPAAKGMESGGECDWRCPALHKTGDWKSGEIRSYRAQMASYALSEMDQAFVDDWTCYLFFFDKQELVIESFAYESAKALVSEITQSCTDPDKEPVPCDYCGWCGAKATCPKLNKMAKDNHELMVAEKSEVAPRQWFDTILADPAALAYFLDCSKAAEAFISEGKAKALEYMESGVEVPGYTKAHRSGGKTIDPVTVGHYIGEMGFGDVLQAYGALSEKKFREIWDKKIAPSSSNLVYPEDRITVGAGSVFIKKCSAPKKK